MNSGTRIKHCFNVENNLAALAGNVWQIISTAVHTGFLPGNQEKIQRNCIVLHTHEKSLFEQSGISCFRSYALETTIESWQGKHEFPSSAPDFVGVQHTARQNTWRLSTARSILLQRCRSRYRLFTGRVSLLRSHPSTHCTFFSHRNSCFISIRIHDLWCGRGKIGDASVSKREFVTKMFSARENRVICEQQPSSLLYCCQVKDIRLAKIEIRLSSEASDGKLWGLWIRSQLAPDLRKFRFKVWTKIGLRLYLGIFSNERPEPLLLLDFLTGASMKILWSSLLFLQKYPITYEQEATASCGERPPSFQISYLWTRSSRFAQIQKERNFGNITYSSLL